MNARLRRIAADYEEIKKNFDSHKNIIVEPIGFEPAEKYKVTYYINGIYLNEDNKIETLNKHIITITLHSEYPRYKPICTIETPIWHPNFRDGQICIGDIWGAGESLCDIIVNIGDMIQYKSWNSFSPLSADAAKWAIENKYLFPVGNINLWTGEEVSETLTSNFDIDIFSDDGEIIEKSEEVNYIESSQACENGIGEDSSEIAEAVLEETDENDFDITVEELEGIDFVPTVSKMQNSQITVPKGGKINFKTIFFKGILYGLIGGFIAWILQEVMPIDYDTILAFKGYTIESLINDVNLGRISESHFYTITGSAILLKSSLFSSIIGGTIGAAMGIGEGIYYGSKKRAIKYGFIGFIIALFISFCGGFLAQSAYSSLLNDTTEYTSQVYLGFVRAIGWTVMGAGVGIAIGLIKPEKIRIINCVLGGIIGGFIGGFLFNFIAQSISIDITDKGTVARAIGIIIMGTLIGLGIGLLEQFAKTAWLKVIRGEFEGKEYLVFKGITSIGNSGKNTIVLFKDKLVAPNHCDIVQEGNRYVLVDKGSPSGTFVNGVRITRHTLKQGDAISLGNSVLIFNTK
ncbi:FHA domain-containing protein [Clostridium botulinum]|uniref:FHA domain-containing protein n=1 Tax=unclassified Clostridium TaxID=2614128 RepID=UPI001D1FEAC4|nr:MULTISPECIES: FHA domain-containing protein [unclassified Clostridium]MBN1055183.1 FHA domain-containing protein [Clostridium botulinum]